MKDYAGDLLLPKGMLKNSEIRKNRNGVFVVSNPASGDASFEEGDEGFEFIKSEYERRERLDTAIDTPSAMWLARSFFRGCVVPTAAIATGAMAVTGLSVHCDYVGEQIGEYTQPLQGAFVSDEEMEDLGVSELVVDITALRELSALRDVNGNRLAEDRMSEVLDYYSIDDVTRLSQHFDFDFIFNNKARSAHLFQCLDLAEQDEGFDLDFFASANSRFLDYYLNGITDQGIMRTAFSNEIDMDVVKAFTDLGFSLSEELEIFDERYYDADDMDRMDLYRDLAADPRVNTLPALDILLDTHWGYRTELRVEALDMVARLELSPDLERFALRLHELVYGHIVEYDNNKTEWVESYFESGLHESIAAYLDMCKSVDTDMQEFRGYRCNLREDYDHRYDRVDSWRRSIFWRFTRDNSSHQDTLGECVRLAGVIDYLTANQLLFFELSHLHSMDYDSAQLSALVETFGSRHLKEFMVGNIDYDLAMDFAARFSGSPLWEELSVVDRRYVGESWPANASRMRVGYYGSGFADFLYFLEAHPDINENLKIFTDAGFNEGLIRSIPSYESLTVDAYRDFRERFCVGSRGVPFKYVLELVDAVASEEVDYDLLSEARDVGYSWEEVCAVLDCDVFSLEDAIGFAHENDLSIMGSQTFSVFIDGLKEGIDRYDMYEAVSLGYSGEQLSHILGSDEVTFDQALQYARETGLRDLSVNNGRCNPRNRNEILGWLIYDISEYFNE